MKRDARLCLDVRLVPSLENAIDRWKAAREQYKVLRSGETEFNYNAMYFALGEAFAERCPEAANTPGAFERFRRSLIAPEEE
jgi:hypothetical protein